MDAWKASTKGLLRLAGDHFWLNMVELQEEILPRDIVKNPGRGRDVVGQGCHGGGPGHRRPQGQEQAERDA